MAKALTLARQDLFWLTLPGWVRVRHAEEESNERNLDGGSHHGVREKAGAGETARNLQG